MTEEKRVRAFEAMENYENAIVIHNYFDDDKMASYFESELMDYAKQMANQEKGHWNDFKKLVDRKEIEWHNSAHEYRVYLQDTVNIDVISAIVDSTYILSINLDLSELEEKHREMMLVDAMWKVYNYGRSFETSRSIRKIEKALGLLRKSAKQSIFGRVTFQDITDYIKGMENFDENQILLWIRLK
jgi:hypothetical protein